METISGTLIKGYELKERIGAGGFGAVYRATQSTVAREVAIKIILPGYASQPEFIRRFETEAQLVARLEHLHIVPLYDYWRDTEGAYLVMRLMRGGSLQQVLQSGPLDLESAAQLLEQVASGLALAHRNQIVHRDIKPSNILLDEDGNAYLTDFGIAKVLNLGISQLTQSEGIIGSPDYLAPEQARGEQISPCTDIYSMGVVLYEMLTGEHPFRDSTTVERLFRHINDLLPPIFGLEPDVAEGINQVIRKATAKNPAQRYGDILAMANAFRQAAGLSVSRAKHSIVEILTPREQEVLSLMIQGRGNREIAQKLVIEASTVKWYSKQIYKKLNVRSRVQAIVKARELNLIVDDFVSDTTGSLRVLQEPVNPYKGLRAFQAVDEKDFYGRDRLVKTLLSRMEGDDVSSRFLAVVGPSGSGKSSLVKAGLIPALWRGELPGSDRWFIIEMAPGTRPLDELETALIRIAAEQGANIGDFLRRNENGLFRIPGLILPEDGSELVVVIDQFEEVFTQLEDEQERLHFLGLLVNAVSDRRSRVRVIVTLRADFYDRPLRYAEFGALLQSRMVTVLPLSTGELEEAIVEPARHVGVRYEDGLVPLIIDEVLYQPGMLPLVQYALTELFETRKEMVLTMDGYKEIGGAVGALGKRAEEIYQEQTAEGQELVRQIFLRLVTLGSGRDDTRRRTPQSELLAISENADLAEEIIETYANYRLFSLDHDPDTRSPTVEVAHEAMMREWARLREWLDESREDIRQERQLARAAQEWMSSDREPSFLLRGVRLQGFETWRGKTDMRLTDLEGAFLEESLAAWDREKSEEAVREARERELEQRSRRILRALVGVFAAATVMALLLTGYAFRQRGLAQESASVALAEADARGTQQSVAETARQEAETSENEVRNQKAIVEELAQDALRQASLNQSLYLASKSQLALVGNNRDLALALGLAAVEIEDPPAESEMALAEAAYAPGTVKLFEGFEDPVYTAMFLEEDTLIQSVHADGAMRLLDVRSGEVQRETSIQGGLSVDWAAALSSDGGRALIGTESRKLLLVDVETGVVLQSMSGHRLPISAIAFSPDGKMALSGTGSYDEYSETPPDADLSLILWNLETGIEIRRLEGHTHTVRNIEFRPDGRTAVSASWDGSLILWDLESGEILQHAVNPEGGKIYTMALSPDGRRVLANAGYFVNLWDVETGERIYSLGNHSSSVISMAFSPDGRMGVSGDLSGEKRVWNLETGEEVFRLPGGENSLYLRFSSDGRMLLEGNWSYLRVWALYNGAENWRIQGDTGAVTDIAFSPDGKMAISVERSNIAYLWDLATRENVLQLNLPENGYAVAYAPDGRTALVTLVGGDVIQYDLSTGEELQRLGGENERDGHLSTTIAYAVDISPDGKVALTGAGGNERGMFLWDLESGEQLKAFDLTWVFSVDISPDGGTAIAGSDWMTLWDLDTGNLIRAYQGHDGLVKKVAFSPDGKRALSASYDSSLIMWDVATGEIIHRLLGHQDILRDVSFHPDGTMAVSASADGTIILWNLETGEAIRRYRGYSGLINTVEVSPDGTAILSGDVNGTIIEWRIDGTLDEIISWIGTDRYVREMTCAERAAFNLEPLCDSEQ